MVRAISFSKAKLNEYHLLNHKRAAITTGEAEDKLRGLLKKVRIEHIPVDELDSLIDSDWVQQASRGSCSFLRLIIHDSTSVCATE